MRHTILTAFLLVAGALAGCSSAPKVAQAPESTRRPANDEAHIAMLKATAELERARTELEFQRRTAQSLRLSEAAQNPASVRTALGIPVFDVRRSGANVVYTARFASGGTRLALSPRATSALANVTRQAPRIVIRGRTDAGQSNPADERVARARAESARVLLVQLGIPAARIRTTWQAAGDTVAPLDSADGRAANRRVEIEVYGAEPAAASLDDTSNRATVAQQ